MEPRFPFWVQGCEEYTLIRERPEQCRPEQISISGGSAAVDQEENDEAAGLPFMLGISGKRVRG